MTPRTDEVAPLGITEGLRRAAERTRQDLGPGGTNYPDVRAILGFVEKAIEGANTPTRAEIAARRATYESLRAALRLVREYPDFDQGGPLPEMMDQVLRGEPSPMLAALDRLAGPTPR